MNGAILAALAGLSMRQPYHLENAARFTRVCSATLPKGFSYTQRRKPSPYTASVSIWPEWRLKNVMGAGAGMRKLSSRGEDLACQPPALIVLPSLD